MNSLWQDIRYGVRVLVKSPGFTLVALCALALGIGANTAIFSAVNAVLLRPLAFPESERLVWLTGENPPQGITQSNLSVPDFADWQTQSQVFEQLAGYVMGGALLVNGDEAERVRGTSVTADFFPLFRTNAARGRALQAEDQEKGHDDVVVLSHAIWQRKFGADPNIVGRQVTVGGTSTTVVGIMPPGFDFPQQTELWFPLAVNPAAERRDNRYMNVVGRLKQNVTLDQAQTQLDTINQRLAGEYNETNSGWRVRVTNLHEFLVGAVRPSLLILLGAVAFVLLIACANVANLLLARATARHKEIAVRTALGASRLRIIRQLLTESVLLSLVGGGAGLLLSIWLTDLLIAVSPPNSPRFDEIRPDARVFLFTLALTITTGLIFGLAPALQASRPDLNEALKEGGRSGGEAGRRNRVRSLLMVGEIALSFMLLAGAGLLIKSFMRLRDVSPGFNPNGVLTMRLSPPSAKYAKGEPRVGIYRQVLERVRGLPGVQAAGATLTLPLGGDTFSVGRSFIREGRPMTPEESANASYYVATPDYFRALQIPLVAGRAFSEQDTDKSPMVVVINETMARKHWPGESPIGKRITIWRDEKFAREIVGVVGDTRAALDAPAGAQMYVPFAQDSGWGALTMVVRTSVEPSSLAATVRNEIHALDKTLPVYNVKTMNEVAAASVAPQRASMLLLTAFASVALLLAVIGIYGITAYYVTQRTHEIGVRMALGAQASDVLRLVVGQGIRLTLIGLALGLVSAMALTRVMATLLYGVQPTDPATFALGALLLAAVALLACYIPARRATKVDPLIALRYE
ncbi:MAG TPA: ABC transporter permease [Pyrinomonadaceae bacterium]|jgi:putative ABC transport system permease protein